MKNIIFTDKYNNKLIGTLSIPNNANSIVIMSHGFQSNRNSKLYVELEKELNKHDIGTFRYDIYGHGELYIKNNKYTLLKDVTATKAIESLTAAIRYIEDTGKYNIALFGSSFGGLLSLITASNNTKIKALVLKSPVIEPINFWTKILGKDRLQKWKDDKILLYNELGEKFELEYTFWEDLQKYETLKKAKNIKCPTLIIHGNKDIVVPIEQSEKLSKILKCEIKIIDDANHDYASKSQYNELKKSIIEYLIEKL